jgi:hypothetical protein
MTDHLIPNQWRVIAPAEGPGPCYVLRNPPNLAFANDATGNRRVFATREAAQVVADSLNRQSAQ